MRTMAVVRIDGDKLRKLRRSKLLSRDELADAAGLDRDHIGRLERGEVQGESRAKTIRSLSKALEVEPREILEDF